MRYFANKQTNKMCRRTDTSKNIVASLTGDKKRQLKPRTVHGIHYRGSFPVIHTRWWFGGLLLPIYALGLFLHIFPPTCFILVDRLVEFIFWGKRITRLLLHLVIFTLRSKKHMWPTFSANNTSAQWVLPDIQ